MASFHSIDDPLPGAVYEVESPYEREADKAAVVAAFAAANETMSTSEYDAWYSYGRVPERLLGDTIERLKAEYINDQLTWWEFEDELATAMGLSS